MYIKTYQYYTAMRIYLFSRCQNNPIKPSWEQVDYRVELCLSISAFFKVHPLTIISYCWVGLRGWGGLALRAIFVKFRKSISINFLFYSGICGMNIFYNITHIKITILRSLHHRSHSNVEAWVRWWVTPSIFWSTKMAASKLKGLSHGILSYFEHRKK